MQNQEVVLTPEGRLKIEQELDYLRRVRQPEVTERLRTAREATDSWDSPEYVDAKDELAFLTGRIQTLQDLLASAKTLEAPTERRETVHLGSRVKVLTDNGEEEIFLIVSSAEADPSDNRISTESPVGRALMGAKVGDEVEVTIPAGTLHLKVLAIE